MFSCLPSKQWRKRRISVPCISHACLVPQHWNSQWSSVQTQTCPFSANTPAVFCHLKYITVSGANQRLDENVEGLDNLVSEKIAQSLQVVTPVNCRGVISPKTLSISILVKKGKSLKYTDM